jgi:hypothetical protein
VAPGDSAAKEHTVVEHKNRKKLILIIVNYQIKTHIVGKKRKKEKKCILAIAIWQESCDF